VFALASFANWTKLGQHIALESQQKKRKKVGKALTNRKALRKIINDNDVEL